VIEKFIKHKNIFILFLGIILAVIMFLTNTPSEEKITPSAFEANYENDQLQTYTKCLEEKIESFLSEINGISKVSVILTVECSGETVYATQGSNSDYVLIKDSKGNESAIPLTEISAKIRGIAVVCDYGGNETLKMTVIELLAALFDIGTNRISVLHA